MPKITLAAVENQVRERYPRMGRSMIRKLAKHELRRRRDLQPEQLAPAEEAAVLINPLTYADPTGEGRTNV